MGCFASTERQTHADDGNQPTPADHQEQVNPENGPGMNTPQGNATPLPGGLHTGLPDHTQDGGANRRPSAVLASVSTPKVHNTKTVRSLVNLKKHTLRIVRDDEFEEGLYRVQFTADSSVPSKAYVYVMGLEKDHGKKDEPPKLKSKLSQYEPSLTVDLSGLEQSYITPAGQGLPLAFYTEEELTTTSIGPEMAYPIVIRLQPIGCEDNPSLRQSQTTFATLARQHDQSYAVHILKQLLWVNGTSYVLHEIFGVDSKSAEGEEGEGVDNSGKECVVCLSESRNTLVLPCRHLCLCNDCAKALRYQSNKCPICRSAVQSFLQIKQGGEGFKGELSPGVQGSESAPVSAPVQEASGDQKEGSASAAKQENEERREGSSTPGY